MTPSRRFRWRAALVLLGVLTALLLVEGLLFLLPFKGQVNNPWYLSAGGGTMDDDQLPFIRPAHLNWEGLSRGDLAFLNDDPDPYARRITFQTDRDGFRNRVEIERAELVMIGDSHTEAGNVNEDETFGALLGRELGVTVRNLGRAGYSPPTAVTVLRRYGLPCRPDLVVWQWSEANDLAESLVYARWIMAGRPPTLETHAPSTLSSAQAWRRRSPAYRLWRTFRPKPFNDWPFAGVFRDAAGATHPMRFIVAPGPEQVARDHPAWPLASQSLLEGHALCRSHGARLIVLLIPKKFRVMGPYTTWNDWTKQELERYQPPDPQTMITHYLREWCRMHAIPFVDATEPLTQAAARGEIVFLPFDTHMSPRGHEVVAQCLLEAIR